MLVKMLVSECLLVEVRTLQAQAHLQCNSHGLLAAYNYEAVYVAHCWWVSVTADMSSDVLELIEMIYYCCHLRL